MNGKTHSLLGSCPPTVLQPPMTGGAVVGGAVVGGAVVGGTVVGGAVVGAGVVGGGVVGGGVVGLVVSFGHPSSEPVVDLTQSSTSA